ncbi:helix-turn-helix domain-containing protein [Actinomadura sp. NTSP31]|uniref:helix-turn-helix domain-containing protein n=1 Tax=Actinomadura sp. NTSP31 TaxID=1735447 RepID=UPI0035BF31D1
MTPRPWLADLRKAACYTQSSLAEEIGVYVTTVSRWETGATEIADRHRRPLAAALQLTLDELNKLLAPVARRRAPGGAGVPGAPGGHGSAAPAAHPQARTAVAPDVEGAAPAAGIPADSVERLRIGLDRSVRTADLSHLVEDWELTAYEHACSVRIAPPNAVIGDIGADIGDLRELINAPPPGLDDAHRDAGIHQSLLRVSAQLCGLMAVALTEAGELAAASRWWRTARQTARASGDQQLQTWICGRRALAAQATGMPSLALRVAEQTRKLAGERPCAGAAEAHAARALSLATSLTTSSSAARARLAMAEIAGLEELFERLPDEVRTEEHALWGWPQRRLRSTRTAVQAILGPGTPYTGLAGDLESDLKAELHELEPEAVRERAEVKLKTSMVLIHAGETSHGLDTAAAALDGLPSDHRTATLAYLARRVYQCVPERDRDRPAAHGLQTLAGQYWR